MAANFHLKEEIRDYWSKRSETFDLAFGHRIPPGPEFDAWQKPIRDSLGTAPLRVLELACGTGEVTRLILDLGHDVTALDFSEAMLTVARAKHAGNPRVRFILADAENTMEPETGYDAIVCRHLVWTLTEPKTAFADWFRVLKPGGKLIIFDGDWAAPTRFGSIAASIIKLIDRWYGPDRNYAPELGDRHARIMQSLPFGDGLTYGRVAPLLREAGFANVDFASNAPIATAQRRTADWRNTLRTFIYRRFILTAQRG